MTDAHLTTPSGRPRARVLGVPFAGAPGANNAITDVPGLEVGYTTLIAGDGPMTPGQGPVRTGVTAILPRGKAGVSTPCWAGYSSLNGNGEMTGSHWLEETGLCELAITITNTASCGLTRDATIDWAARNASGLAGQDWGLPVAAETYDGYLNDINGHHVTREHVFQAIETAHGGALDEGAVGGGAGMICYGFKGGSGTASRTLGDYTLGAFVQANFGRPHELTIAGLQVGPMLEGGLDFDQVGGAPGQGSIIVVIATDAPLLPHQLKRLARRATLGLARTGTVGHHSSGDIFLALSTANAPALASRDPLRSAEFLAEDKIDPLFEATVQATEEAILNALAAGEDMVGRDGHSVRGLPLDQVARILGERGLAMPR
jgi:L-aminopeptidase/D-esterase-like protein